MMYILSQEELDALKSKQQFQRLENTKKMQALCTKIANEMPVKFWGNKEARPWGCMLTAADEWYCDHCPVETICPSTQKSWSK